MSSESQDDPSTMKLLPYNLTATEALKLLRNDTITVEEYVTSLLERIKERDGTVKAWAHLDRGHVLDQARALDKKSVDQRGPLHGLAIGIKDIMDTQDMPTQYGSPIYQGHRPTLDSAAVSILREAGALIFGKTTTTEFTVTNSGPETTNPRDPKRTPGGSSCGSAAAVADLQVPLSLGAQTGGSIIRPASFTGVFAMKPTFAAVSTEGQKAFAPTFDTLGFFARSIEDLQLLADVFAIQDNEPPKDIPLEELTIALIKTPMWSSAGPGTEAAMNDAATVLQNSGATVNEVSFPSEIDDFASLKHIQKTITVAEAQVSFLREYRADKTKLAKEIREIVENKIGWSKREMLNAQDDYSKIRHVIDDLAGQFSVIVTPSAVDEAPLGLDDMGSAAFNTMWTGFHMPVINVPAFVGENGMPIGISLVASRCQDQQLLRTAQVLSELLMDHGGWKHRV